MARQVAVKTKDDLWVTEAPEPGPEQYVSYANCDAVCAAGKAPIYRGDPGFEKKFDSDGDGDGCES